MYIIYSGGTRFADKFHIYLSTKKNTRVDGN